MKRVDRTVVMCVHCQKPFLRAHWDLKKSRNHFCHVTHYYAWVRGQQVQRFWSYVTKSPTGCWQWTGPTILKYGVLGSGKRGINVKAHRFSYTLHKGPIPQGKYVLHTCDNPPCVNPDHLWIGDIRDNTRDMVTKRRHMHGERHYGTNLTNAQVILIRAKYQGRKYTMKRLAQEFDVRPHTILSIIHRKTWKHL